MGRYFANDTWVVSVDLILEPVCMNQNWFDILTMVANCKPQSLGGNQQFGTLVWSIKKHKQISKFNIVIWWKSIFDLYLLYKNILSYKHQQNHAVPQSSFPNILSRSCKYWCFVNCLQSNKVSQFLNWDRRTLNPWLV